MNQLIGLGGIPLIRELVKTCNVKGYQAALLSLVIGVILNLALAVSTGNDLAIAVAVGIIAGLGSNVWHEVKENVDARIKK